MLQRISLKSYNINQSEHLGRKPVASDYEIMTDKQKGYYATSEGEPVFVYIPNVFNEDENRYYSRLVETFATPTDNRTTASGVKAQLVKKRNGEVSKTRRSLFFVKSGVFGFRDREKSARSPGCRMTAYTAKNIGAYNLLKPFVKKASDCFMQNVPERYENQRLACENVRKDYIIPSTVFSTVTVNKNFATAYHTDKGDYREGFGVICRLGNENFKGAELVLPKYRVAIDTAPGSILLVDVHQIHGNMPMTDMSFDASRITCVFYLREKMYECKSPQEELKRAQELGSYYDF